MADRHDRDRSIEHLVRRTPFPARAAESACVDAEQLAAWSGGGLGPNEAELVETHLSDCDRCQAVLAAFAESAPATPAVAPFWQRWTMRWLVPATAAAIGVVGWTLTRGVPDVPDPATMARVEPAGERPAVPLPTASADAPAAARQTASPADTVDRPSAAAAPPAATGDRQDAPTSVAPPPRAEAAAAESLSPAPAIQAQSGERSFALPAAPPPPLPAASAGVARPAPAPAPPAAAAASRLAEAGRTAESRDLSAKVPQEQAGSDPRATRLLRPGAAGQNNVMMDSITVLGVLTHARLGSQAAVVFGPPSSATSAADGRAATSPPAAAAGTAVIWRISSNGRVERWGVEGTMWTGMALPGAALVTAGSAPSSLVCWLVTRDGRVLRSVNALDFQQTAFAVPVALDAVQAVDADRATVTSTDGRTFVTTDGGATWQ